MATWDRRPPTAVAKLQDQLVKGHVGHVIAPFSPVWRERFSALGRKPESLDGVAALETVPAIGERDVSPRADPAAMAALVVQAGETGFALHAPGPDFRRAVRLRATRRDAYRRLVDADTRATSYCFSGLGFRYPLASTRSDLDVITRAGARLWSVLGLSRDDVLVSALPTAFSAEHRALELAALGAGSPALFPGADHGAVAAALRLAPATVLAVSSPQALATLSSIGDLSSIRTLLLVGAATNEERQSAKAALADAGAGNNVVVLSVHAPSGARVLWGECRESKGTTGLHTYPDLDVVQVVDPDTGESAAAGAGELTLTQLELRGSALLRWRTGDLVERIDKTPCPACGRTVPRAVGVSRSALVVPLGGASGRVIDLRALAAALLSRTHLQDWRVVVGKRPRDGAMQVVVHLVSSDDEADLIIAAATDLRAVAGALPSQIVVTDRDELANLSGSSLSPRQLLRE